MIQTIENTQFFFEKSKIFEIRENRLVDIQGNQVLNPNFLSSSNVQLMVDSPFFVFKMDKNGQKELYSDRFIKSFRTDKDANCILKYPYIFSLTFNQDLTKEYLSVFDIENEKYLLKTPETFMGIFFDKDRFYVSSSFSKKLISYSLTDFSLLWQYEFPKVEYSQGLSYAPAVSNGIENILGVYDSILWIVSDVGHLIGIESETGKCKYRLKVPDNIPAEWGNWEVFIPAQKSFIDIEKGIIFGLDYPNYWECNLNNPSETYLRYDISQVSKNHSIVPDFKGNWLGDEIFFGQNSFAKDPTHVGIFNRKTRQITWTSHELGNEGIFKGLQKIEMTQDRLYVLDRAGTLHIFERDSPA
ncbi:hypothetical protein [Runella sp.]|uniref:hypothetical protein n=1 Tax=Runella sp. TaxID=1960881 RepID=UPI003D0B7000